MSGIETETMQIELQLGDVIQITNPSNEVLNHETFLIEYIDRSKMYLLNVETLQSVKLPIREDGILGDGHITQIDLLSRAESPSYARQHGLLPKKWVNIYFGGEVPAIITAEITNLEKDMIELKTTDGDILYINFDYKGIPEELPIESIEVREKPSLAHVKDSLLVAHEREDARHDDDDARHDDEGAIHDDEGAIHDDEDEFPHLEADMEEDKLPVEQVQMGVPLKDVRNQLREFILKADQIQFGEEELGPIVQYVDVSSRMQRYSIEDQVSDLLDDLLSTIPDNQRTPRVLQQLHVMIERFKQLRTLFSSFDQYGNVSGIMRKNALYKPLHNWLQSFNANLYWILPVVKNVKKVYDVEDESEENETSTDYVNYDVKTDLSNINRIISQYKTNTMPSDINKYTTLNSELDPYFTPFSHAGDENTKDVLYEKRVEANLNVIIDNLGEMYSTVAHRNEVRNRRFVINRYNLGNSKLMATDFSGAKMTAIRVPMSPNNNDLLSLKSLLTLPEPTIRFSRINLPTSDMLTKANLNQVFLNYWQLLKKKTNVSTTFVDKLDAVLRFDENTFMEGIRNYALNVSEEDMRGLSKADVYQHFINAIVPKTRVLFRLMQKYIKGKLSIPEVVSYLEPFLVYTDDLTFKQYEDIVHFIDRQISGYNKHMLEMSRVFKLLSSKENGVLQPQSAYRIVELLSKEAVGEVIQNGYGIQETELYSNSELLRRFALTDCGRLYTARVGLDNLQLMYPHDVTDLFEQEQEAKKKKMETTKNTCENIVIAKMYHSMDQLEADNGVTIYFDRKYDQTNYGLMEEDSKKGGYADQVLTLPPDKLRDFIRADQMKKNHLTEADATYVADTLVNGMKRVIDGQYAILLKNKSTYETDYFVRKNDKWEPATNLNAEQVTTDETSILCDLQKQCVNVPAPTAAKCTSVDNNEVVLQTQMLKQMIQEFDSKYKTSKETFEKNIREQYEYFMSIMPMVAKIEGNAMLKYNNERYKLGLRPDDGQDDFPVLSPYVGVLNIILSLSDFNKKQMYLLRFCEKFTRPAIQGFYTKGSVENEHWLYCIKTGVPLVPAFKKQLAKAALSTKYNAYVDTLNELKSSIGQISDDGDYWVDKHSGWPICKDDFSTEEGFNDAGFRIQTRDILEEDVGAKIVAPVQPQVQYITPEAIAINNIVNAISVAMGINLQGQKEFILNGVLEAIRLTVESETDYKEKVMLASQKGKQMPSYREFFNTSLLYYTLGMYLIATQTAIPSIKTRKTHPGCVRSFGGYPFDGQGDLSSLEYLVCVVYDIRTSSEPWNVLRKTNTEKIKSRLKMVLDSQLVTMPEVQRKFAEKAEYMLNTPANEIPEEHDISMWTDFLPPLVPFHIRHLTNISDEFKRSLVNDLRSGSIHQREKILVIESKIIQFSLAIQEKIQRIVKDHRVLLHTANNEPYLENACCDSPENEPTIEYFVKRDKDIAEYNHIVQRLSNLLDDIRANTEPVLFTSSINTKNAYPPLNTVFNEKTIYMAFIFYCKFKSTLPIPEMLQPICASKPDEGLFNGSDSLERIIQKLKDDGRHFSNEQFLRLVQLVSQENMVAIDLNNPVISTVAHLSTVLDAITDARNANEMVDETLVELMKQAIDTFDIASETTTREVKHLNNHLLTSNEAMVQDLAEFIRMHSRESKPKVNASLQVLRSLETWELDTSVRNEDIKISSDAMYTIQQFYKTFVQNFAKVFPSFILNRVSLGGHGSIPAYVKKLFSSTHIARLEDNVRNYFNRLSEFNDKHGKLSKLLRAIQRDSDPILSLAESTPSFSSIQIGDKKLRGVIDERTSRYLYEYYLLRVLTHYADLADKSDMIVQETTSTDRVYDLVTVEYLEEERTRAEVTSVTNSAVVLGNKSELKRLTADLLVVFLSMFQNEKTLVDTTYEDIQDRNFKLKEREKDLVTDRLKALTDEARDADTMLKITKQGDYSKGLQKGLRNYDRDFYENEQQLRDEMEKAERIIAKKKLNMSVEDFMEQQALDRQIEEEVYDMRDLGEDFMDGHYDGAGDPEYDREYED